MREYEITEHYYLQGYFGVWNHYERDVEKCSKCGTLFRQEPHWVGFQMEDWGTVFKGIKKYNAYEHRGGGYIT